MKQHKRLPLALLLVFALCIQTLSFTSAAAALAVLGQRYDVFQWHGCRRSPPERCHATLWVVERHNHRGLYPHGDVHGQLPVQLEQQQRD